MKKTTLAVTALLIAASPLISQAEGVYGGLKLGAVNNSTNDFDNATNIGLNGGYAFKDFGNGPAIEGEFTTTTTNGRITATNAPPAHWNVDTYAIYGVYRMGGSLYGKMKLGYLHEKGYVSGLGPSFSGDDNGVSFGIGGGWSLMSNISIEAEYTRIESDIDYLSLGVIYTF